MGNGYDDHHHSIHWQQRQFHQKSFFLPMFCRLSIKDVKLNNQFKDPISADDPSSPRVSCIGQVKRNNRVIGFPTSSSSIAAAHHCKHLKNKKRFSTKSVLPNIAVGGRNGSRSCRTRKYSTRANNSRTLRALKTKCDDDNSDRGCVKVVDISEMDPPLPVVKRLAAPGAGRDEVNLWKRRINNGTGIKTLHIEKIQLTNSKFQPPSTAA